jgi:gamma-carbonic anhydrase
MIPHNVAERLKAHLDRPPAIAPTAYVHPRAVVQGDVLLGEESSVWPCAVLRGDINRIQIGRGSNVQDGSVLHLSDSHGVSIGSYVTVGHMAMLHACTIEDECLIGMNSIVLDGAVVGTQSIVGAGALVTGGTIIPPGSLVLGSPAKVVRALSHEERAELKKWALKYVEVSRGFKERGV